MFIFRAKREIIGSCVIQLDAKIAGYSAVQLHDDVETQQVIPAGGGGGGGGHLLCIFLGWGVYCWESETCSGDFATLY